MLNFIVTREGSTIKSARLADAHGIGFESRWDWASLEEAQRIAELAGPGFVAIDRGSQAIPQYDVIRAPIVGKPAMRFFNGNYYACGHITSVSRLMVRVETTCGMAFYRVGNSDKWQSRRDGMLIFSYIDVPATR